ncbi:hypothetical protein [Desulfosporosinus fructosivorans]
MTILNKADQTQGKIQYYVRVKPGDVAKYVLLPGDPARADRVNSKEATVDTEQPCGKPY